MHLRTRGLGYNAGMDLLLQWRDEFPILGRSTYLISNSLGAMPRAVYDRMHAYADTWATRGVRAWEEGWWELATQVGDQLGALFGAPPGTTSVHQNVTTTQAILASCLDFSGPRNKVVMADLEFPSIQYFYAEYCRRAGARLEMVASQDGIRVPLEKLLAAIDEQTLLVPISYVLFRSACIVDARAIIERAHQVGALVCLDLYQATGTLAIDVRELNCDFAVGGCIKWLCGGPGVAYLYVREDLYKKFAPAFTGWFSHQRPFAFEPAPIARREDAYRYLHGTTQVPALYACQPGAEIISKVGVANIRAKSMRQTQRLMDLATARGWRVNTPENPDERGGTVSIDCPHAEAVSRELLAREILVDYRPSAGIRMSPHFYTKDEELDFAISQVDEILQTRAWERHAPRAAAS
jgi:kynureninase